MFVLLSMQYSGPTVTMAALIRPGSMTHSTQFDQAMVFLTINTISATSISVVMPPNGAVAAPGKWMFVVLTADRTPNHAQPNGLQFVNLS